jgi:transcription elongation factor Elf1
MIVEVTAKFACDDCGTEFENSIDPACEPPDCWSVFAVAEDAIRAGRNYRDATEERNGNGMGSVGDDGRHYCDRCTTLRDKS